MTNSVAENLNTAIYCKIFLEKVEELSLYVIEQEKRIEELEGKIKDNSNQ